MASSRCHFCGHVLLALLISLVAGNVHRGAAETDAGDAAAMRALAKGLRADRALGWTGPADPCTWTGVTCAAGRVTAIQIGNRSLVGTLPAEVRNLTALLRLELQENQLSGSLPSLAGLSSLQALLLHRNRFSGVPPPDFFAGLSSLQSVYVDDNPFDTWSIPAHLKDAATLVNFSANSANVSGDLPEFLATAFPSLDHLALAFNLLSGPVPAAYAAAPFRSLWLNNQLGSSRLSGSIAFVANMTSIEELWLHSNDFSGPLPDFSALQQLADLQLRDNSPRCRRCRRSLLVAEGEGEVLAIEKAKAVRIPNC